MFEIKIGMVFALEELAVDSDTQGLLASNNVGTLWPGSLGEIKRHYSYCSEERFPDGEAVVNLKGP